MKAAKIELLAIITIVKAQIKVLESLRQFELAEGTEQFTVMRKNINRVIGDRKAFCRKIKDILDGLAFTENAVN